MSMHMKNRIRIIVTLLSIVWLSACEDKELATLREQVQPNELNALTASTFVLEKENEAEIFQTFTWSAVDFGFDASVNYTLQMDKTAGDFSEAFVLASTRELEAEVTVSHVNDGLLGLGLTPEQVAEVKFRVVATVNENVPTVVSDVINAQLTPYATAFPPIYGMGAALKGWGPWPDNAVEFQSSEYKKYQTVTYFTSGEIFRFFDQLDWGPVSYNYNYFTTVDSDLGLNANDGDNNFKVLGASGYYSVAVDLVAKTVVMDPVDEPVLYMMGAALNGWGPWNDKEVKMTYVKPGIFQATAQFNNEIFRFFAQADWGPTSYSYTYFTTVDANFELNANDNDNNFRFIGDPTIPLKITVDLNEKTVTVGDEPIPPLFMMGAALNGWGPWNDKEVNMTYVSEGVYTATATFISGEIFRFFAQADWNPTSYNYNYFTTVDPLFELNPGDGDNNLKYVGATGSVSIRVNLTTKVLSVE